MKYRKFGNTDIQLSALGFGTMRLPVIDGKYGNIDEQEAIKMIRYAIDNGVNYMDTAYMYHEGNSETVLGKALKDGYREKTYIADKMPPGDVNSFDDMDKIFETQLERLQVDNIEFYLIHCITRKLWWDKKDKVRLFDWCDKIRSSGKIKYLGFSFHDSCELFKEVIDSYNWDFCQIQYNYINEDVQAGTEGLNYAAERGIPVMIMEPLLGGALANPAEPIKKIWDEANLDPTETALLWLWDKPEIATVLSGMSSLDQVKQNIKYAEKSGIGNLADKIKNFVSDDIVKAFRKYTKIPCTKCFYCRPCPQDIDIPYIFDLYNCNETKTNAVLYKMLYSEIPSDKNASACIQCRKCEKKCPQNIKISELMPQIHKTLSRPQ